MSLPIDELTQKWLEKTAQQMGITPEKLEHDLIFKALLIADLTNDEKGTERNETEEKE